MLIRDDDATYLAGPLDAILILRHVETGRYHVAFFEERPPPGPSKPIDDVDVVRLMSRMHHTEGSETLDGANVHVDEIKKQIDVHGNVFRHPVDWTGAHGVVLLRSNWLRDPSWQSEEDRPTAPPPGRPR